jgi:hypothetical protein
MTKLPWAVWVPANRLHRENWSCWPATKWYLIRPICPVQIDSSQSEF